MVKFCGIEFNSHEEKLERLIKAYFEDEERYIIKFRTIYQLHYCPKKGFYTTKVCEKPKYMGVPYIARGHFMYATYEFMEKIRA